MEQLLIFHLGSKRISSTLGGSAFAWPDVVQGDDLWIKARFANTINGRASLVDKTLTGVKASLGAPDAAATGGDITFDVGEIGSEETTAAIAFDADATAIAAAFNALSNVGPALTYGACSARIESGSWYLEFAGETTQTPIRVNTNQLTPAAHARIRGGEIHDDQWEIEIRVIQALAAFVDTHALVVPPAPVVEAVQDGFEQGDTKFPEVQLLKIDPAFRGKYIIKRDGLKSHLVVNGLEETAESLQDAVAPLIEDDPDAILRFVDAGELGQVYVYFDGSLAGVDQALLEVEVIDAPAGDANFTLATDKYLLQQLILKDADEVKDISLEFEFEIEDPNDSLVTRTVTFQTTCTVKREANWDGLATVANIDWQRPPQPWNYIPFTTDQVITGSQYYTTTMGDGAATSFVITHNLATESLAGVVVRDNTTPAAVYTEGTDYDITIDSANAVTIDWTGAPATPASGALAITIATAGPVSAFQAHTHTIAQIAGLQTTLDALTARVAALEGRGAIGVLPARPSAAEGEQIIPLTMMDPPGVRVRQPRELLVLPLRKQLGDAQGQVVGSLPDLAPVVGRGRPGGLLPAIHDAATDNLSTILVSGELPDPAAAHDGKVYLNDSGAEVTVPGAGGRLTQQLLASEFVAAHWNATDSIGYWGQVVQYGSAPETSYYPADFEVELFKFTVNAQQLLLRREVYFEFALELAMLQANTEATWVVVVEIGLPDSETSPATTGLNLKDVVWEADPILEQAINIASMSQVHDFGLRIKRELISSADVMSSESLKYGEWTDADGTLADFTAANATDLLTVTGHAFLDGHRVMVAGSDLPEPLATNTTYYVRDVSGDDFKLAATDGGAAIDLTDDGTGTLQIQRRHTPPSADFAIRARLIRFDVEDDVADPRGYVAIRGLRAGRSNTKLGIATIS